MAPFSKPETVLKQAEGLVSVGQTHAALQSLTEMFSSKRFRSTPLASLEPIMHRFVELCVDMRKGRTAKEGLMQYKNIAQNTSVQSIEAVITRFVQLADQKVREAQAKAASVQVTVDVDDLEASETPESILLGAVSGDQSKDRTDRALVTPWLKFLWESYRTSLETLKNNARLEVIYQTIAQQAFAFCLTHSRKVEFRRLCETLRLHLANVAKYAHQPHSINLADPDTLQHHLDTRFAQLNTSVELELWQEAFRSVEDVHNLLVMAGASGGSKKGVLASALTGPRAAMMANYYEKLTRIFLMSGNALYHAAAWGRYHAVSASSPTNAATGKKATPEDAKRLAGHVLLSALAVPVGLASSSSAQNQSAASGSSTQNTGASAAETRLTTLLGLSTPPTRASLLSSALAAGVLKLAPKPIQQLYEVLEVRFDPLALCGDVAPILAELAAHDAEGKQGEWAPYVPALQRAVLSRLMSQLAQVYASVRIAFVLELVAPLRTEASAAEKPEGTPAAAAHFFDPEQVESYIMGCARRGELAVRVDHAEGSIAFVDEAFGGVLEGSSFASSSSSAGGADAAIQPSAAELVRTRLSSVARCLHNAVEAIAPPPPSAEDDEAQQKATLKALTTAVHAERRALQLRRALVARRRELLSELAVRKEKEDAVRRAEAARRAKDEADKREREETRRRELERVARIQAEVKAADAEKYRVRLIEQGIMTGQAAQSMGALDTESIIGLQVAQLEKEKKEVAERLRIVAKRVDHIERANRKEERPLLAQDYAQQQAADRETFVAVQGARRDAARRAHEEDLETKKRLARMVGDYEARRAVIIAKKGEEYAKKKDAASRKIEEEKAKRRKAFLAKREEERRAIEEEKRREQERLEEEARIEAERAAEEERLRAEQEAAAAAAEAAKREAEEKAVALRKAREAERAEAMEKARLQQQREDEAAARASARLSEKPGASVRKPIVPNPPSGIRAPAAAEGGVWRRGTGTPAPSTPVTPTRAALSSSTPPRAESPSPAPQKYVPGALRGGAPGGGGGWRDKFASSGGAPPARVASPAAGAPASAAPAAREPPKDDDGFQTVPEKKGVWRPSRGRGRA